MTEYEKRIARRTPDAAGRLVAPVKKHGTTTAYANHGCRCSPCSTAWSARLKARRAAGKTS